MKKRNRKKMSNQKRMYLERAGWSNRHHIHPKSRGGRAIPTNLILLDERRHSAFHLIFGNRNFVEAAQMLLRAYRMKTGVEVEL
jgi:hypothetical protein